MIENNNQNLNEQLYNLKNSIEELQTINSKILNILKDTIILDDSPVGNREINKIANNYQKITEIINNEITIL